MLTYSAGLSNGELPILILSQYTSRYDATSKLLPDFVVDFFRIISRQKKVNVTVRLHPKTAEDHIAKRHSIKSLQDQLHFLNILKFEDPLNTSLVFSMLANKIVVTDASSAYKTSLSLEKITIYWSSRLSSNQIDLSSRRFLLKLNNSNIQEVSSHISNLTFTNSANPRDLIFSYILSKADQAYQSLKSL